MGAPRASHLDWARRHAEHPQHAGVARSPAQICHGVTARTVVHLVKDEELDVGSGHKSAAVGVRGGEMPLRVPDAKQCVRTERIGTRAAAFGFKVRGNKRDAHGLGHHCRALTRIFGVRTTTPAERRVASQACSLQRSMWVPCLSSLSCEFSSMKVAPLRPTTRSLMRRDT